MKIAKKRRKYILADLHNHINLPKTERRWMKFFERACEIGIIGSSKYFSSYKEKDFIDEKRISYETFLDKNLIPKFAKVKEIDKGRFLEVKFNKKKFWVVNVREIYSNEGKEYEPHFLAIGCPNPIENNQPFKKLIRDVRKQGGILQINHPGTATNTKGGIYSYIFIWDDKEKVKILKKIMKQVDGYEVFNAQQINFALGMEWSFLKKLNAKKSNKWAKEFLEKNPFKNLQKTASTDAHGFYNQLGTTGILIPLDKSPCWKWFVEHYKIKRDIKVVSENTINYGEFIQSMIIPRIKDILR